MNYYQLNETGNLVRTSKDNHIREAIRSVLLTRLGERSLSPKIGSEILDLLYKPLNPALEAELAKKIRKSIDESERRIRISELSIEKRDGAQLSLNLSYQIEGSNKTQKFNVGIGS